MQLVSRLKKVEESMEKEVKAFFRLVGASEAPEEWESCSHPQDSPRDQEKKGAADPSSCH